jgi:hypothetical protein
VVGTPHTPAPNRCSKWECLFPEEASVRSPFVRVFFIAAAAFFVVQGVRYYPKLPPRPKAQFAMLRENYTAAIHHWNDHIEQNPSDNDAILELAECFDKLGDQQTAAMIYHAVEGYLTSSAMQFGHKHHRDRFMVLRSQGY